MRATRRGAAGPAVTPFAQRRLPCPSAITRTFPSPPARAAARCGPPVVAIYRFARAADDLADEGDAPPAARLAALDALSRATLDAHRSAARRRPHAPFAALARGDPARTRCRSQPLPRSAVGVPAGRDEHALRDVRRAARLLPRARPTRWAACCSRSTGADDAGEPARDATPSAPGLQLINFWQDVAIDWRKGRVYLPAGRPRALRRDRAQIARGRCDAALARADARSRPRARARCSPPAGRSRARCRGASGSSFAP